MKESETWEQTEVRCKSKLRGTMEPIYVGKTVVEVKRWVVEMYGTVSSLYKTQWLDIYSHHVVDRWRV